MLRPLCLVALAALGSFGCSRHDDSGATQGDGAQEYAHFRAAIENVSGEDAIRLSGGGTVPAALAPVLWVVHRTPDPLFAEGRVDRGEGLESLAEDGSPARLSEALRDRPDIIEAGVVAVPRGGDAAGPLGPGGVYEFEFEARPGDRLTIAMMFAQSNDLFYAPSGDGIELFGPTGPTSGNVTASLTLWDAGTETNQEPGAGADQAPRQREPNTGETESAPVHPVDDGFTYPAVERVIRLTLETAEPGNLAREAVTHLDAEETSRAFAEGRPLVERPAYKVHASRRSEPGLAEVHDVDTDIVYVLEGEADLVTDGSVVNPRRIAPEETRGSAIEGGTTRRLARGDFMTIPAGVPHWFRDVDPPFLYYVVKVPEGRTTRRSGGT